MKKLLLTSASAMAMIATPALADSNTSTVTQG